MTVKTCKILRKQIELYFSQLIYILNPTEFFINSTPLPTNISEIKFSFNRLNAIDSMSIHFTQGLILLELSSDKAIQINSARGIEHFKERLSMLTSSQRNEKLLTKLLYIKKGASN